MDVNDLLSRLEGVRPSGDGWIARCPAHEDRHQSLKIDVGDDGRILVHCHAGCATEDVVARAGLEMKDLMPEDELPAEQPQEYDYTDEDGSLLYQVVRKPGKRFLQRKPDASGGWTWKLNGVRRVPFRLGAVRAAASEGRVVFVVEGEKDVLNLEAAGLVATCNAGGAGKWGDDFGAHLAGAHVAIIPDLDGPGFDHARDVAASVTAHAASVRVLDLRTLDASLPAKSDVSDYLGRGGSADDLRAAVKATAPVTDAGSLPSFDQSGTESGTAGNDRERPNQPKNAGADFSETPFSARRDASPVPGDPPLKGGDSPEHYGGSAARDFGGDSHPTREPFENGSKTRPRPVVHHLAAEPEPGEREWFVDRLVPAGAVSILAGHSGLFKSFLALYLATCVCLGKSFFGHRVKRGSVLWVDAELDRDECSRRAYWIARGLGLMAPPEGLHYVRPLNPIGTPEAQDDVLEAVQDYGCDLVILDSLTVGTAGKDMKDGSDVVAVMKLIEAWAGESGAVLAIDHITKTAAAGNQADATIYGSAFKRAIARSTMKLTKAMGGAVTLHPDKASFGPETPPLHFEPAFRKNDARQLVLTLDPVDALSASMAGAEEHMGAKDRTLLALVRLYDQNFRQPVRLSEIAEDVDLAAKTVRNHLSALGSKVIGFGDNTYTPAVHRYTPSTTVGNDAGNGRERSGTSDDWTEPNRYNAPF